MCKGDRNGSFKDNKNIMVLYIRCLYTTENSYENDIVFLSTDPPKYYIMHLLRCNINPWCPQNVSEISAQNTQ